jgi:O-antigen/teichoic acid export membrane protein
MLGLEYTLVKKASTERSQMLGTAITIEFSIILASLPLFLYFLNNLYLGSMQVFGWIAVGILIFTSLSHILRSALLGISDAKSVLIFNSIGTGIQFIVGYVLVSMGYGAYGILLSFLSHLIFMSAGFIVVAVSSFSFKLGNLKYAKEIIKDALINMPAQLSRVFIFSLSVVLLASFGVSQSEVGIFYIALMLSVIGGGLAANIALMAIPASSESKRDLSTESIRIGLSLTAPIIVILIVGAKSILYLIGSEYASAETVLIILSIGIFPYTIVMNAISKFNNLGKSGKLISIGSIQISIFLVMFYLLVPVHTSLGAALSIFVAFVASSVPSIIWSDRVLIKYIASSGASVIAGLVAASLIEFTFYSNTHPIVLSLISMGVTLTATFALKCTSPREIGQLVRSMVRKN